MDSEVEYGILPMPKLDEDREDYYGGSGDNPIDLPLNNQDMDFTGRIAAALTAEGYRTVQPAIQRLS